MDKSQYIQPREYELMVILLPDQPETDTQAAIDAVVGYITDQQGEITSLSADSPWGRRRLAYTIRHDGVDYRDGFYFLAYFTALPSALSDIERELKLDTNVIRYLLLTHDPNMGEKIEPTADEDEDGEDADVAVADDAPAVDAADEVSADEAVAEAPADAVVAEDADVAADDAEAFADVVASADATAEDVAEDAVADGETVVEEAVGDDAAEDSSKAE